MPLSDAQRTWLRNLGGEALLPISTAAQSVPVQAFASEFRPGGGAMPGGDGSGGAPSSDGAEGSSHGEVPPAEDPQQSRIDARRAERDAPVDEYGIAKPATSWTETLTDAVAPPEILNDPSTPWYEQIARAVAAAPAGLAGHFMDNLSPVDSRGHLHMPIPVLGELAHGAAEERYRKERAAHEEKMRQEAESQTGPAIEQEAAPQCEPETPEAQQWESQETDFLYTSGAETQPDQGGGWTEGKTPGP